MDIKKDLCHKGKFSSLCLLCIMVLALIVSPGPMGRSCAEVIIDDPRTLGVDLDDEPRSGDNSAKATITSTGSVTSSGAYVVRGGSTGWNINIETGGQRRKYRERLGQQRHPVQRQARRKRHRAYRQRHQQRNDHECRHWYQDGRRRAA